MFKLFFGPNAQQRYYPQPTSSTSSATNLIHQPGNSVTNQYPRRVPSYTPTTNLLPPNVKHPSSSASLEFSISEKFSLSPDPKAWGSNLSPDFQEPDDYLHNPDPQRDRRNDRGSHIFTYRGLTNFGCLILICVALVSLFAGYALISHYMAPKPSNLGGFNLGGTNASRRIPRKTKSRPLIDPDTPKEFLSREGYYNKTVEMILVFSDEFNEEGRGFGPGEDPFWEALDLHYWQTDDLEWYSPEAITTRNGSLEITLSQQQINGFSYKSGMVASWNKLCFTGGLIVASVSLPGSPNIPGLWPSLWTMGNLGRVGHGASLEGVWPYTYDDCDVGTAPNQTYNGIPRADIGSLSYLPGQKLSRCTCSGEPHPGPEISNGTENVGRGAPEIDIFEAQVDSTTLQGTVSQSAQYGPFNAAYRLNNAADNVIIHGSTTRSNEYVGGPYQQAVSAVTETDPKNYYETEGGFSQYGAEYRRGYNGSISWIVDDKLTWTMKATAMSADSETEVSARPVSQEPMYLIINLGLSQSFGYIDFARLKLPAIMRVDYIRVYQPKDSINIGCNPEDYPTAAYIDSNNQAYTNPKLATWKDAMGQSFPKNKFMGQC